ncbi:glycosyltransferase family 4 protein [Planctomycetota bacterium]|nr:glycosyltransferase family 4 protein [Planctomycetota bacterium]
MNTTYLSQYLEPLGYETILAGGALDEGDQSSIPEARRRGIHVVELGSMRRSLGPLADLLAVWQIIRLIRKFRPVVVHTHTAKAGAIGRFAAWLCRVPVIVHTFHGHVFEGYFSPRVSRIFQRVERVLARMSDRVIAISPSQLHDLSSKFKIAKPEKFTCVPLGFELDRFKNCDEHRGELRAEFGLEPEVVLVGLIGRLVPIKNHSLLLEAIARLDVAEEVRFFIVGDGHVRGELERQASELGIADKVIFTGARHDAARIYADLDIVALTSINEGTPVTLIEAMAAGKAIVTTDVGGIRDILPRGYGAVVESGDVGAFARALEVFIDDEVLRAASVNASPEDVGRFEVDRLAGDMDRLYRALLQRESV